MAKLVLDLPEAEYHALDSLSSTGARRLIAPGCPALFDYERRHPRTPTPAMRLGRAAHRVVLGVGSDMDFADYPNYRTKEAREWRDAVEAAGRIPMLTGSKEADQVLGMRAKLRSHEVFGAMFDLDRGDAEASAFWTDEATGVECRARFDYLPHPQEGRRPILADYKTTEDSSPASFARSAAEFGYPMQADWYLRGARELYGTEPAFVFVVQSKVAPYLVSVAQLAPSDMALAAARNDSALRVFRECSESGAWPGWGDVVHTLEMPVWWRAQSEDLIYSSESETAA